MQLILHRYFTFEFFFKHWPTKHKRFYFWDWNIGPKISSHRQCQIYFDTLKLEISLYTPLFVFSQSWKHDFSTFIFLHTWGDVYIICTTLNNVILLRTSVNSQWSLQSNIWFSQQAFFLLTFWPGMWEHKLHRMSFYLHSDSRESGANAAKVVEAGLFLLLSVV